MVAPTFRNLRRQAFRSRCNASPTWSPTTSKTRDLVQEALIGLYPAGRSVAATGTVEAYVRHSIVNAGISRWRKVRLTSMADPPAALGPGDRGSGPGDRRRRRSLAALRRCRRSSGPPW
ncbi:MAG: hypothetical protein IPL43_12690 [Micropruina sp.]|nr:hypothetical protein [Micropruina sp.]